MMRKTNFFKFSKTLKPKDRNKNVKNDKFKQTFNLLYSNKTKYIKTPEKSGEILVKIKIWDTTGLKKSI